MCQHVVDGLIRRRRVGFFWPGSEPEASRPDAWCADCDERVSRTGGEWRDESLEHLEPQVLCGACYDGAKVFHMGGPFTLPER